MRKSNSKGNSVPLEIEIQLDEEGVPLEMSIRLLIILFLALLCMDVCS